MKKLWIYFLIFALLLSGCAGHKPDVRLEAPPSSASDPTGTEPSGTVPDPSVPATDPVVTGEPAGSDPSEATEAPGPDPSQAPAPTEAPKPTEAQPKPTEAKPQPTTEGHQHSYKAQTVAPTCTSQGYTLHTCSCGDSYRDSYTSATGHSYDGGKVTKAASCSAEGVKTYTCTKCGSTKTEAIAKTAHSYTETVVAPTYSAGGYTQHTCSVCGYSYTDAETAALEFDIDYWVEYAKNVAREMGFIVEEVPEWANSEVPGGWGGWDSPIPAYPARVDSGGLEKEIKQAFSYYKNQGVTSIWVWAERNPYTDKRAGWYLYIAYA